MTGIAETLNGRSSVWHSVPLEQVRSSHPTACNISSMSSAQPLGTLQQHPTPSNRALCANHILNI